MTWREGGCGVPRTSLRLPAEGRPRTGGASEDGAGGHDQLSLGCRMLERTGEPLGRSPEVPPGPLTVAVFLRHMLKMPVPRLCPEG